MATSVSASRWRTAWNWRSADRTGPARARAAGQLEHRPRRADQLVADGQLAQRDRGRPGRGHDLRRQRVRRHGAVHLDETEARVDAVHRPQRQVGRRHARRPARCCPPRPRRRRRHRQQGRGAEAADDEARPVELARWATSAERRQHDPGRGRRPARWAGEHVVERRRRGVGRPWSSKRVETAVRVSSASASGHPSSASAASSAAPVCALARRGAGSARTAPAPSPSISGRLRGRAAGGR